MMLITLALVKVGFESLSKSVGMVIECPHAHILSSHHSSLLLLLFLMGDVEGVYPLLQARP